MENASGSVIGILGAGHLGGAILSGLRAGGKISPDKLLVYDPAKPSDTADEQELIKASDYIFLCLRPDAARELLAGLEAHGKVILSAVAGLSAQEIEKTTSAHVLRIMPNLPVEVCLGAVAYADPNHLTEAEMTGALALLEDLGTAVPVPETLFAAVTGLSGSGPAYVYMFLKALIDAGCALGLTKTQAENLAIPTLIGAATLAEKMPKMDLGKMIESVATPSGTTEAGVKVLRAGGFEKTVMEAVKSAAARADELLK